MKVALCSSCLPTAIKMLYASDASHKTHIQTTSPSSKLEETLIDRSGAGVVRLVRVVASGHGNGIKARV